VDVSVGPIRNLMIANGLWVKCEREEKYLLDE